MQDCQHYDVNIVKILVKVTVLVLFVAIKSWCRDCEFSLKFNLHVVFFRTREKAEKKEVEVESWQEC